jgi:hypothetical protein
MSFSLIDRKRRMESASLCYRLIAAIDGLGCKICSVQRHTKLRRWEFSALFKPVYTATFGWWLDPLLQRKKNRALLDDVQAHFAFLTSDNGVSMSNPIGILPFDYASVEIRWEHLLITITRGRGDTTVTVAPLNAPQNSCQLGPFIAALEHRRFSERDIFHDLSGAANLLHPRLEVLKHTFSEKSI